MPYRCLLPVLISAALFLLPTKAEAATECSRYAVSKASCTIKVDLKEIESKGLPSFKKDEYGAAQGTRTRIVFKNPSVFTTCSLKKTDSDLARDSSAFINSLVGIFSTLPALPSTNKSSSPLESFNKATARPEIDISQADVVRQMVEIKKALDLLSSDETDMQGALDLVKHTYDAKSGAQANAVEKFRAVGRKVFELRIPDLKDLATRIDALSKAIHQAGLIEDLSTGNPGKIEKALQEDNLLLAQHQLTLPGTLEKFSRYYSFLHRFEVESKSPVMSPTSLYIAPAWNKKIEMEVSCKDAVTGDPVGDSAKAKVFAQHAPMLDVSPGALVSTVQGRTVAVDQVAFSETPDPANPGKYITTATYQARVHRTSVQFMPAIFVEWRPAFESVHTVWTCGRNLCNLSLAGGFMVNPNNDTKQAEFFEGVSLGIGRLALLIGNHTGRSLNFAVPFAEGQISHSTYAPLTARAWSNGLAFGIAYRIPVR